MSVKIFLYIITSLILIGILKPVNSNISRILTLVISVIIAITSVNYIVPAIELIKKLAENNGIIVLTDSDSAGGIIRSYLRRYNRLAT